MIDVKYIKYKILGHTIKTDENGEPVKVETFATASMPYSEKTLEIAKGQAYNGEYTIEDDGVEEVTQPTQEERIKELEEALELLLSGVAE